MLNFFRSAPCAAEMNAVQIAIHHTIKQALLNISWTFKKFTSRKILDPYHEGNQKAKNQNQQPGRPVERL